MIIIWEVDDGYVGYRPHEIEIPDEEFENCDTQEIEEIIEDYVKNEFETNISYSWKIENKI